MSVFPVVIIICSVRTEMLSALFQDKGGKSRATMIIYNTISIIRFFTQFKKNDMKVYKSQAIVIIYYTSSTIRFFTQFKENDVKVDFTQIGHWPPPNHQQEERVRKEREKMGKARRSSSSSRKFLLLARKTTGRWPTSSSPLS